jgi:tetratricopeptide (TPR) repeat protein
MVREAIATARNLDDYGLARMAVRALHTALQNGGRFEEALAVMEEDLASRHDQGMLLAKIDAMRSLVTAERHLGAYDKARFLVETFLPLSKWQFRLESAHRELGCLALAEGTYDEARDWLQQALVFYETTGERAARDELLATLTYAARGRGQHTQAQETLLAALQLTTESRHHNAALQSLPAMALLLLDSDETERAVELYALASRYPYVANSRWFEDIAGREIASAAEKLPPEVVAAAQERGRTRDLWGTVEELLDELATDEPENSPQSL